LIAITPRPQAGWTFDAGAAVTIDPLPR